MPVPVSTFDTLAGVLTGPSARANCAFSPRSLQPPDDGELLGSIRFLFAALKTFARENPCSFPSSTLFSRCEMKILSPCNPPSPPKHNIFAQSVFQCLHGQNQNYMSTKPRSDAVLLNLLEDQSRYGCVPSRWNPPRHRRNSSTRFDLVRAISTYFDLFRTVSNCFEIPRNYRPEHYYRKCNDLPYIHEI